MRTRNLYLLFTPLLLVFFQLPAFSQVTVAGPTCVIPGTVYQYLISGPWDSVSTMQVCLTGGVIADTTLTCTPTGQPQSAVLVTWNGTGSGSLQISSSKGSATLSVSLTDTLSGGTIDSSAQSQQIGDSTLPASITCSPCSGGSCSPSYLYQWQQSPDILNWTDIPGASGQNLSFTQALTQTTFFRRKVTETGSGTIAYSSAALVDVGPPAPTAGVWRIVGGNTDLAFFRPITQPKSF